MNMSLIVSVLVGFVAFEHLYFMVLEMFLWTTPRGRKAFAMTEEYAKSTAALAANQGIYNGFLALGLIWSLLPGGASAPREIQLLFLGFIVFAGVYGGKTVNKKIFFIQSIPATICLILMYLS